MANFELALLSDRFLRRLHVAMQTKAPSFDKDKIGPGGALTLFTLAEMEPVEMHRLTERMVRDKSQMTRIVRSLEEKGLITRTLSSTDGRVCLIGLTEKGREVMAVHQQVLNETIDEVLLQITSAEKDALRQLLFRAMP